MLSGCGGANDSEVGEIKDPGKGSTEAERQNYREQSMKMMPNMKVKPKEPKKKDDEKK
jgi:hypothetical protein